MKKKTLRILERTGCLSLAVLVALAAPGSVYASAAGTQKDETVYVNLDSAGAIQDTIVSDWLHSDDASQRIVDKSDLKNIQNVKTGEKASLQGDTLTWALSSDNTGKNIYYQGTTDKKTPLTVSMAYTLDGKPVSAQEIAGKSGKVTVSLTLTNTDAHTVSVNGKDVQMYTPMTAVAAAILPSDTFKNVTVNSGKLLTDGNNQYVAFLAMPGLSESLSLKDSAFSELSDLNLPETLTIEADAVNFHLPSITVAATPKLPDADKLAGSGDVGKLTDCINNLKDLQSNLQNADPQKNISSLITNPDRTAAAKLLVDDVFDFYGLDTSAANLLPKYVNDNTFALADRVTSDLTKADLKYLVDNHVLDGAAAGLSQVNMQSANALLNDYAALSTFDTSKLNGAAKLLGDAAVSGGDLSTILRDTANLISHTNVSALAPLGALGNPDVQSSLAGTLSSMSDLSAAATAAGIPSSGLQLQTEDMQALMQSYLTRQLTNAVKSASGGTLPPAINQAALSSVLAGMGVTDSQQQAQLMAAMVHENPDLMGKLQAGEAVSTTEVISTIAAVKASGIASQLTTPVNNLLKNTSDLQTSLSNADPNYANDLTQAMSAVNAAAPYLSALQSDYTSLSEEQKQGVATSLADTQAILADKQSLAYLAQWATKLNGMSTDLKNNSGNIAVLTQMMQMTRDPHMQNFLSTLPSLKSDLTSASSVASSLQSDLARSGVSTSRSSLTNTMNTLLKMRNDVNNSKTIMTIFRQALQPDTVSVFRQALSMADTFQSDAQANGYQAKLDSAQDLLARKDAYLKLADESQIFSESADGASTSVKFVYKTAEIKKPAAKPAVQKAAPAQTQSGGIGGWFKSIFASMRNFFHF